MKEVVLIRLAAGAPDQLDVEALRDYVAASIELGVLVLGPGADLSVVELPEPSAGPVWLDMGSLRVGENWDPVERTEIRDEADEVEEPERGGEAPSEEGRPDLVHTGRGAKEKARIAERLRAYRQARGLGSFSPLSDVIGCSDDYIRMIYNGELKASLAEWRRIEQALDAVEGVSDDDTGEENDNG